MNTRLQVEHPVTELVTGIDLVARQIRVAAGEPLAVRQEDVALARPRDRVPRSTPRTRPTASCPSPGHDHALRCRGGPGVRVDSARLRGLRRSRRYYDSLLAKLIVWDATREDAIARMRRALDEFRIEGITTIVPFHRALLASDEFGARRDRRQPVHRPGLARQDELLQSFCRVRRMARIVESPLPERATPTAATSSSSARCPGITLGANFRR